MTVIFLLHNAATLFMTGVIWFVQVVHYPLFDRVGGRFADYVNEHARRTAPFVAPVMILEVLSGCWLAGWGPAEMVVALRINAALLLVTWLSTFLLQVPLHRRLREGGGPGLVPRLVAGNWIRTICWSVRCVLLLWLSSTPPA